MTSPTAAAKKVEQINGEFARRTADIRSNRDLTSEAKRRLLAKEYLDARSQAEQVKAKADSSRVEERARLEREMFGIDRFVSTSNPESSRASLSISYRDARDRAAQVESDKAALDLLRRAERGGDEMLARAVAEVALDNLWADTLNAFAAARPGAEPKLQTLVDLNHTRAGAGLFEAAAFYVSRPSEVTQQDVQAVEQAARAGNSGDLAPGDLAALFGR